MPLRKFTRKKSLRTEVQYENRSGLWWCKWPFLVEFALPQLDLQASGMYNVDPKRSGQWYGAPRKAILLLAPFTSKAEIVSNSATSKNQVEGVVCSGGICRLEPAFGGVRFSLIQPFNRLYMRTYQLLFLFAGCSSLVFLRKRNCDSSFEEPDLRWSCSRGPHKRTMSQLSQRGHCHWRYSPTTNNVVAVGVHGTFLTKPLPEEVNTILNPKVYCTGRVHKPLLGNPQPHQPQIFEGGFYSCRDFPAEANCERKGESTARHGQLESKLTMPPRQAMLLSNATPLIDETGKL